MSPSFSFLIKWSPIALLTARPAMRTLAYNTSHTSRAHHITASKITSYLCESDHPAFQYQDPECVLSPTHRVGDGLRNRVRSRSGSRKTTDTDKQTTVRQADTLYNDRHGVTGWDSTLRQFGY